MKKLRFVLSALACAVVVVPVSAAIPKASDVPPLVKQLGNKDAKARAAAAKELGHIGAVKKSLVKDAIPNLIEAAKDSDINVQIEALSSLGRMGAEPEKVVPILIENLKSNNDKLVVAATQSLAYYGSAAEDAIPVLKKLAEDNKVPRNRKEAEAMFKPEELRKRQTISRAVGEAMRTIGGGKK